MTVSVPFQQQFTWRKLGYLFFSDSLSYREVLNQNPQWKVTELPPLGAQLRIRSNPANTRGLTQGDFLFGVSLTANSFDFYPFATKEEYVKALIQYSPSAVADREVVNGYAMDTPTIVFGG